MSDPTNPQWDLLPNDPEGFFNLSGEYDLKDLKRKYNSFIRQFKPEKFPDEFQKIRAAFEYLNDALRYQENPKSKPLKPELNFDWDSVNQAENKDHLQNEGPAAPTPLSDALDPDKLNLTHPIESLPVSSKTLHLHERVNDESSMNLYQELQEKVLKTPYDYYALAVFSDLLQDGDHSFYYWLLEGLKIHEEEPALFELLRQFFKSFQESKKLVKLLEATSQVVRSDRFYYLTESAWDHLIRDLPFDTFKNLLETCEQNLIDHEVDHRMVFYIHILKPAIWKADNKWIDEMFCRIEDHYDRMSFWLEEEFEFLYLVKIYQEQRVNFLRYDPTRVIVDLAISEYCTQNEQDADRCFLEYQHEIISLDEELQFDLSDSEESLEIVKILWEKIADDVFARIDPDIPEKDASLEQQSQQLAVRLLTEGLGPRYKLADDITSFIIGAIVLGTSGLSLFFLTGIVDSFVFASVKIGVLLLVSLITLYYTANIMGRFAFKYYQSWWRFEIMRFYQSDWFPLIDLADELEKIESIKYSKEKYSGLDKIAMLMRDDLGLFFYVTAQRLLNVCQ